MKSSWFPSLGVEDKQRARSTYLHLRVLAIGAAVALAACLLVLVDAKLVWAAPASFTAAPNVICCAGDPPPETFITSGPDEGSSTTSNSATFGFSSDDVLGSTFQCQLSKDGTVAQAFAACTSPKDYSSLTPGNYKFEVKATDSAGVDPTPASRTWTITGSTGDTAPTVIPNGTVPKAKATNVDRTTNVTATFSEGMLASSINTNTFKLYKKGSTTKISATVSYDPTTLTATLNPFGSTTTRLARGTTYKAVVTTGAKDLASTSLDQNPSLAGNQQKAWLFTTTP